jgi:hypothetical protein
MIASLPVDLKLGLFLGISPAAYDFFTARGKLFAASSLRRNKQTCIIAHRQKNGAGMPNIGIAILVVIAYFAYTLAFFSRVKKGVRDNRLDSTGCTMQQSERSSSESHHPHSEGTMS